MENCTKMLGFIPQKEIIYNKTLPYAVKLVEESQLYLSEIKSNLANAVLNHEIIPEVTCWINHLSKYIKLYGRKFSKEDHLYFIHLLFDLILIPDLQLNAVCCISSVLHTLLKKCSLLSRDDLILPWHPLYDLHERTVYSSYIQYGLLLLPGNFESSLKQLIRSCRPYFSDESTQEMLDEWRPLMCPFDVSMCKAILYFDLFLCTKLPPEKHDKGFKLWFEEFVNIWEICQNSPPWENSMLWLFSRLAQDNMGYINWEPHISTVFTRLLRSFNLPCEFNKTQITKSGGYSEIYPVVKLIAAMLGNDSSCQLHINRLFKALESYYHPSNFGRWNHKLQKLLHTLPACIIKRLHRERYRKPTWDDPHPEKFQLTDNDVTEFVLSVKPIALLSMFSKSGSLHSGAALHNLAILHPEIIIPPVLDRLYSALETLIEPHRLIAAMHCAASLSRSLVQSNSRFTEGRTHVIPLLMASLPGIDPNDIKKCVVTFQFVSTFACLVLFVNSASGASDNPDMSLMEKELCLATAAFEDFVLQFMDRCFLVIENSSLDRPSRLDRDTERLNQEESIMGTGLSATFSTLLTQCSPEIFKSALRKLYNYVSSHIFEVKVSGKYVANLCRSAAKVNAELALETFVPHFTKIVVSLTENPEVVREEKLDDELMFSLLLLSEVVRCDGAELLNYLPDIEKVLHRTIHLKCKEGYLLSCALLKFTLRSLTQIYPLDFCSVPNFWERCEKNDYSFINEWGKPGNIGNLDLKYHVAGPTEMEAAQNLLETFLMPEVNNLTSWANDEISLTRDDIQCSLNIILDCLCGPSGSLPMWDSELYVLKESSVPLGGKYIKECGCGELTLKDGRNVRLVISDVTRKVLVKALETASDDTKSLFVIIKIYQTLVFNWGIPKEDFDSKWKGFHIVKKALENKLQKKKLHIRPLLVDRSHLQNEMRLMEKNKFYFTELHADIMKDLLQLSVSHYTDVRIKAQSVLLTFFSYYPYSYKVVLPILLHILAKDPAEYHEEFKGALYVIYGNKQKSLLMIRHWDLTNQLWPAIICAKHSEKLSITKLLDSLVVLIQKMYVLFQIELKIPDSCINIASCMWNTAAPKPAYAPLSPEKYTEAAHALARRNESYRNMYIDLVKKLVDLIENKNLHWRQYLLAFLMLVLLVRYDIKFPVYAVRVIVQHLIHDTLSIRKVALNGMSRVLKQLRPLHGKKELNLPVTDDQAIPPILQELCKDGTPENFWLQYNSLSIPGTQEIWDKTVFVHKTYLGFYMWPKAVTVYSSNDGTVKLNRRQEELQEAERPIFEHFTNPEFIEKLIEYLSLEEKKGHDKFNEKKFDMFHRLFHNFGDTFLPLFVPHLQKLTEDKQESSQRCAAEILSGIFRGCKHWNFEMVQNLKEYVSPIMKTVLKNLTPETLHDWETCIATGLGDRDPRKFYWLLELLMEAPVTEENGSFLESGWLYLLSGALAQQEWRVCELLHRLLDYLKTKLSHSYQNVRERIGSLLSDIFMYDVDFPSKSLSLAPKTADFVKDLVPKLAILQQNTNANHDTDMELSIDSKSNGQIICKTEQNHFCNDDKDSEEKKEVTNIFRTTCRWLTTNVSKKLHAASPEIFQILPILCTMLNDTADDGVQKDCTIAIIVLGNMLLRYESVDAAVSALKEISKSESWHSRSSAVSYLRLMVFSNLFVIMHNEKWLRDINDIVLMHLHDVRIEVREAAAETLSGLLHCEVLVVSDELLATFKSKCQKKLKRAQHISCDTARGPIQISQEELRERHAGVLGLCSCVNAFPYDVPDFMPEVLVLLSDHLHDPQPIENTIRKTLSNFRRTHYDNWHNHKLKFTDDQLTVITDLLVSPSYYA